jgi:hypothetical protein
MELAIVPDSRASRWFLALCSSDAALREPSSLGLSSSGL